MEKVGIWLWSQELLLYLSELGNVKIVSIFRTELYVAVLGWGPAGIHNYFFSALSNCWANSGGIYLQEAGAHNWAGLKVTDQHRAATPIATIVG